MYPKLYYLESTKQNISNQENFSGQAFKNSENEPFWCKSICKKDTLFLYNMVVRISGGFNGDASLEALHILKRSVVMLGKN